MLHVWSQYNVVLQIVLLPFWIQRSFTIIICLFIILCVEARCSERQHSHKWSNDAPPPPHKKQTQPTATEPNAKPEPKQLKPRPKEQPVLRETSQAHLQNKQASKHTRQKTNACQRRCVDTHRTCDRLAMGALPMAHKCMATRSKHL